ncbi:MAG: hypothetical protein JJE49_03605 [Peptostreptococcaceae bacterium]|nr:hypothetical protein [Peptostreptococcaceae bacterium]
MPEERILDILNIIVHKVEKEQYTRNTRITLSENALEIDEYSKLFLNEFIRIYQNPRKTSKSFAQFDKDEKEEGMFKPVREQSFSWLEDFITATLHHNFD